jgi:tRNA pseudouridine38/39 synthase
VDGAIATVLSKPLGFEPTNRQPKKKQRKNARPPREFQFDNYAQRYVAIKFLYIGEKYDGLARQDHTDETVEHYLFRTLIHTKLIKDIASCGYTRCGRTDKGVSAFGQVISLKVRSSLPANATLVDHATIDEVQPNQHFRVRMPNGDIRTIKEIDYPMHLTRALPADIRVYAVVPCAPTFSARFDCVARMYRYFFLRKQLDIDAMRRAAQKLVGCHDFRNFCRIDTSNETFVRAIQSFEILQCDDHETADPAQQVFRFEIVGKAFLWHQVRCMTAILFLIGAGRESPETVDRLLDIDATPRKPQYDMAADGPLCLQDCMYDSLAFTYSPLALHHVYDDLYGMWEQAAIKTAMLRSDLDMLQNLPVDPKLVVQELDHFAPRLEQLLEEGGMLTQPHVAWKRVHPLRALSSKARYFPLFSRNTGHSVQEAKDQMADRKRRRLEREASEGTASSTTMSVEDAEP